MKVHIICPVFPPESIASAVMAQHIADGLTHAGHETTVITSFPSKMKGELFPGFKRIIAQLTQDGHGFRLCRVFTILSRKSTSTSRSLENLSYALASNIASILLGSPDVVYMNTWPIISTFLTALFCTLRGVPFIYNIQDIYPESAAGLGIIRENSFVYKLLLRMDRFTMSRAAQIITNSEEFAELIHETRGVQHSKMTTVWNWYDASIVPGEKWGEYRNSIVPTRDSYVVMYAGNVGSVAGLEVVLDAAELLTCRGDYVFVLAGDGTLREQFQQECKRRSITNVKFYYPLHREDLGHIQSAADIMLITAKKGLALSEVPSKMMAYMLSGRPILAMVEKESNTARLIEMSKCGLVGQPEDAIVLANLVERMSQSGRLDEWGGVCKGLR
jgi:glycosyltransferase involved in cell wall biosynthesis